MRKECIKNTTDKADDYSYSLRFNGPNQSSISRVLNKKLL